MYFYLFVSVTLIIDLLIYEICIVTFNFSPDINGRCTHCVDHLYLKKDNYSNSQHGGDKKTHTCNNALDIIQTYVY